MRIGIVNDMPLAVEMLRRAIALEPELQVAWVAANGQEAVDLCARDRPDLVLMDLIMPVMDGVEATRRIMAETPCAIVVVTADVARHTSRVFDAMGHGALDAAARRRDPDFGAMLRSRLARELSIPRDPATPLQPVDAVSGALMVLPRSLFMRIGGFDEGYRLHAEDLDLCRRVRQAGAMVAVANKVEVLHVRGVSSRARPLFVEWHKHRGLWRYFRKFEAARRGRITRVAVFAMIWGRFPLAALRAALRR